MKIKTKFLLSDDAIKLLRILENIFCLIYPGLLLFLWKLTGNEIMPIGKFTNKNLLFILLLSLYLITGVIVYIFRQQAEYLKRQKEKAQCIQGEIGDAPI